MKLSEGERVGEWITVVSVLAVISAVLGDIAGESSAGKCARLVMGLVFLCATAVKTADLFT